MERRSLYQAGEIHFLAKELMQISAGNVIIVMYIENSPVEVKGP